VASRSFKNNNPGNIRWGSWAESRGAVNADGYAKWGTPIQGLSAMVALLSIKSYRDLTIREAIQRYAPAADHNSPQEYSDYVLHRSWVPEDVKIGQMDPFQLIRVVEAMIRFEGWQK
jgi:hypothetical protein